MCLYLVISEHNLKQIFFWYDPPASFVSENLWGIKRLNGNNLFCHHEPVNKKIKGSSLLECDINGLSTAFIILHKKIM